MEFVNTIDSAAILNSLEGNAEKPVKVKKPKPIIRERKRRAKKGVEIFAKKLIREESSGHINNFVIQFPEELNTEYGPEILKIEGAVIPALSRIPYNPHNDIPEEKITFLSVYKVRVSEETLQAVVKFGKSRRFTFESDIAVRAQMSSIDGKELEKLSFAKSYPKLKMPPFQFGKDPKTKKQLKFLPFQQAGVAYALKARKTFIADEMGLGKTVQAIGTMACDRENVSRDGFDLPWLLIVPANLRINWYKECRKWLPKRISTAILKNKYMKTRTLVNKKTKESRIVPTKETKDFLAAHSIFILSYDKIHRYKDILSTVEFRGIVLDESQYVKGRSTKRTIGVRDFVRESDPEYILLLSGTPLMNRPIDMLSQLQILGRLDDFGGYNHFLTRYCTMSTGDTSYVSDVHSAIKEGVVEEASEDNGNVETVDVTVMNKATSTTEDLLQNAKDEATRKLFKNMIALNKSMRSLCFIRREKKDVLKDLPEKSRQTLSFEINNRKDYEAIENDVIGYLMDKVSKDEKFLESIKKYNRDTQKAMIAARRAEKAASGERAQILQQIEYLKQAAAVGKLKAVKEWIDNFLESGKKLVVFAYHKIILNELAEMYPEALFIRREMSDEKRQEAVETFQKDKKKNLIIVGLKLAVGMTLTAASDTLTIEFGWNPAIHDQAEDRVHRIGQKEAVTAFYAVAVRTIEEKIGRLIEKKRRIVNAVADGDPLRDTGTGSVLGDLLGELTGSLGLFQ